MLNEKILLGEWFSEKLKVDFGTMIDKGQKFIRRQDIIILYKYLCFTIGRMWIRWGKAECSGELRM